MSISNRPARGDVAVPRARHDRAGHRDRESHESIHHIAIGTNADCWFPPPLPASDRLWFQTSSSQQRIRHHGGPGPSIWQYDLDVTSGTFSDLHLATRTGPRTGIGGILSSVASSDPSALTHAWADPEPRGRNQQPVLPLFGSTAQ